MVNTKSPATLTIRNNSLALICKLQINVIWPDTYNYGGHKTVSTSLSAVAGQACHGLRISSHVQNICLGVRNLAPARSYDLFHKSS